jgi:hypothetical protein
MLFDEAEAIATFHPEEAGIMLDRLATELVHADAKNPRAVSVLQEEAQQLLACVSDWLATRPDADEPINVAPQNVLSVEPLALAETLRGLAETLLLLAELAEADSDEVVW